MSLRPRTPACATHGRLNAVLALGPQVFLGDQPELQSKVTTLYSNALGLEQVEKYIPEEITKSTQYRNLTKPSVKDLRSATAGLKNVLARNEGDVSVEKLAILSYGYLSADIKRTHELVTYILTKSLQSRLKGARLLYDQDQIEQAEQAIEEAKQYNYWNETELDYDTGGLFETNCDDDPVYRQS